MMRMFFVSRSLRVSGSLDLLYSVLLASTLCASPVAAQDSIQCDYTVDIDRNDNGLIEICDIEALNAIRYQLDGSGYRESSTANKITSGCPSDQCNGYELIRSLDFFSDASYRSTENKALWTTPPGWQPIGDFNNPFTATFSAEPGSATPTISNLILYRPDSDNLGLFGAVSGRISGIHLRDIRVGGRFAVGGLAGVAHAGSLIYHSSAYGIVFGSDSWVGGMVGSHFGSIVNSHAKAQVTGHSSVGGLVGYSLGVIVDSYAQSQVEGQAFSGGLVGYNHRREALGDGLVSNSYASGSVDSVFHVGGLVGYNDRGTIADVYAIGNVIGNAQVGGLVGYNDGGEITRSYAAVGVAAGHDSGALVGYNDGGEISDSYWDIEMSGVETSAGGMAKTGLELRTATATATIYVGWSTDNWEFGSEDDYPSLKYANCGTRQWADAASVRLPACGTILPGQDRTTAAAALALRKLALSTGILQPPFDPTKTAYEALDIPTTQTAVTVSATANTPDAEITVEYSEISTATVSNIVVTVSAAQHTTRHYTIVLVHRPELSPVPLPPCRIDDIDRDGDGLIEICDIEGLASIHYQLDGTAYNTSYSTQTRITAGCPLSGCIGYELEGDLDFRSDDSYRNPTFSRELWSVGRGWRPIGHFAAPFRARFKGNGHTISHLRIGRDDTDYVGLFGYTADTAEISNLALVDAYVSGRFLVGGLVGRNDGGTILSSFVSGDITVAEVWGGGLIGDNSGLINNSYARGTVSGSRTVGGLIGFLRRSGTVINSSAASDASGRRFVGALLGFNEGRINNSYASGDVASIYYAGGLVSLNDGDILNSYARGNVIGELIVGGLVGDNRRSITNSYASGVVVGDTLVGMLAGNNSGTITNSYARRGDFDLVAFALDESSTIVNSRVVAGEDLRLPTHSGTTHTDVYYQWPSADWDFGSTRHYTVLKYTAGEVQDRPACDTSADTELPICGELLGGQYAVLSSLTAALDYADFGFREIALMPPFAPETLNYSLQVVAMGKVLLRLTAEAMNGDDIVSYKIGRDADAYSVLPRDAAIEHELIGGATSIIVAVVPRDATTDDPNLRASTYIVGVNKLELLSIHIKLLLEGLLSRP